ncbi:MAG: HTTM domain-containing protein [Myxococcales bacterium]|nr:HTTM domain-containing protein [Myxococcales bacterium]
MSLQDRVDDILRPRVPAERLAALRILVGAFAAIYVFVRAPALASVAHQTTAFAPVGPVKLLSQPLPAWSVYAVVALACATAIPFVLGWRYRITAPVFAVSLLWATAYRNSFGMIFHTENLTVLHVIVLALSDAAAATSLDARGKPPAEPSRRYGVALVAMSLIAGLAYALAAVAKLRVSGFVWITGDALRNHIAHDNLRKLLLGDGYSVPGAWAVRHAWIFPPFAALTIVIELLAPLAILHRRIAVVICGGLWAFHFGVLILMWIFFPYPLSGIAFLSFFPAEKVITWLRRRVGRAP